MDTTHTKPWTLAFFFAIQWWCWLLAHLLFNFTVTGKENIPRDGACILACNHVSFVDWLLIASICPRPIRYTMYVGYFTKWATWFFNAGQVVPICSKEQDELIYRQAFGEISRHLSYDRLVCIFPEGKLTTDGEMHEFKRGIEKILRRDQVPVVPARLSYSLWGHWSTRSPEHFKFWKRPIVNLVFGKKIEPSLVTAHYLECTIRKMEVS